MARKKTTNIYVYETQDGTRWRARYRSPGGRIVEKRGFASASDADAWLTTERAKLVTGTWIDPTRSRVTVGMLADDWLELKKAKLKPSSYAVLEGSWRLYVAPRWAGTRIEDIVHSDVARWLISINMSPSLVHRAYGVLTGILRQAVQDGRLPRNPAEGVGVLPTRRRTRPRRYLTPSELNRLADAAGEHRTLVLLLGYCGLRWGEAIALRASDIDVARRRIKVSKSVVEVHGEMHLSTPKTAAGIRPVPVPRIVLDALAPRLDAADPATLLFPNPIGSYMRRVRASKGSKSWWKTALRDAELPDMVLHDLRHTAASIAVSLGGNVKAIQRMLGHESAAMTLDVYSDLFEDDLDALLDQLDASHVTPRRIDPWQARGTVDIRPDQDPPSLA